MWHTEVVPLALPFARLNLTRNPFGELPLETRSQLAVLDIEVAPWLERLREPGFALQITGECGRGKTTHLLALRQSFPNAPHLYRPEDEPSPRVPHAPLLFLDEMQRFSAWTRGRLLRRSASFVIGTHGDHRAEFRRAGLDYGTLELRGLSPERLRVILERRVEAARRAPGPVPTFEPATIHALIEHFGDDLRSIQDHLYEVFQRLDAPRPVRLR